MCVRLCGLRPSGPVRDHKRQKAGKLRCGRRISPGFGAQSGVSSVVCVSEVCSSHDGTTVDKRKVYLPEAVGVANYDSSPMINNSGSL